MRTTERRRKDVTNAMVRGKPGNLTQFSCVYPERDPCRGTRFTDRRERELMLGSRSRRTGRERKALWCWGVGCDAGTGRRIEENAMMIWREDDGMRKNASQEQEEI